MRLDLPTHALLHPITRQPIKALAFRKDGRPVWPILGGDPTNDPPEPDPAPDPAPDPKSDTGNTGPADKGFPDATPVAEMSVEQQAAYWKFQSRRHEERVKAYGEITPEKARESLTLAEQLRQAALSDQERAVEEAKTAARQEALLETAPRLVAAEFRAAAKGALTPEQTTALIEDLDLSKFLKDNGDVDVDKVTARVAALAPKQPDPKFPNLGQGRREGAPAAGVAAGKDMFAARRPKATNAN